jgi:hypothetical protein
VLDSGKADREVRVDVGNSVRRAIEDYERGEVDSAMIHACNAVDGTAAKLHPTLGSNARFTALLRDSYFILEPMAAPGINLDETRFPVKVKYPKAPGGQPDFADIVYGIHRCHHNHGEALPGGFELLTDASGQPGHTCMEIEKKVPGMGRVRLSDRVIFGLLNQAAREIRQQFFQVRVWTAVYATRIPRLIGRNPMASVQPDITQARRPSAW